MIQESEIKQRKKEFKLLLEKIKEYKTIVIYRHQSPDFDALGSQLGLKTWIKDNFPDKNVVAPGDVMDSKCPSLFPYPDKVEDSFYDQEHLAITVDVANLGRISAQQLAKAKEVYKLDHHPLPPAEQCFGDRLCVHPSRPAASEIIALFTLSLPKKYILSKEAASYLYVGIVGDSGRFSYQDVDGATLRIAGDLIDKGIEKEKLLHARYDHDKREMGILKFVLDHYQDAGDGIFYYVLKKEDFANLNRNPGEGNLFINSIRDRKECEVAISISYDELKNDYRVSLRSKTKKINEIANLFNGGGHDFAAGCHIKGLEEIPQLIEALKKVVNSK